MSNEKHTQEPWRANDAQADIDGPNGEPVAVCYCNDESGDDAKENARRIVACVNACAGIPTDMLERFNAIVVAMYEVSNIEKQRDTLLKLVECISQQTPEKPDYWSSCSQCEHNISDAEDAIASVKEQA